MARDRELAPGTPAVLAGEPDEACWGRGLVRSILDTVESLVLIVDFEGRVLLFNRSCERVSGYAFAEVRGEPFWQRLIPDDLRDEVRTRFLAMGPSDLPMKRETEWMSKAGDRLLIAWSNAALVTDAGEAFVIGTGIDITEKRRAEQGFAQQSAVMTAILETMSEGVLLVDPSFSILVANPAGSELVDGAKAGDKLPPPGPGGTFVGLNRDQPCPLGELPLVRALAGERVAQRELFFRRPGERIGRWESVTAAPVRLRGGATLGALMVTRNADEQKLQEETLRNARDLAQSATKAKSRFLAAMSHEIRTPMNGILGMTELLMETKLNPQQNQYLEMVRGSTESLLDVVNDVLDISKIESGRFRMEPVPFDLRDALLGTLAPLAMHAQSKGLRLTQDIARDLPPSLVGDVGRFRQVIINLVGNAIKFTEKGEIRVTAALLAASDDEAVVELSVRDTGMGIPVDKMEDIFIPFNQGDPMIARRFGGTGLGLSIAAQLVHLMGGLLQVESAPDVGSTFHFTVRFHRPAAAPSAHELETLARGELEAHLQAPPQRLRILLAEDNRVNQLIMVRHLEQLGHVVRVAETGLEVLELHDSEPFDLVLMDLQMPEMDGLTATAAIRERERRAATHVRTRIVVVTAHAMKGDRESCFAAGADGYLAKPVHREDLLDVLREVPPRAPAPSPGSNDEEERGARAERR